MGQSINLIPQSEKQDQVKTEVIRLSSVFSILLVIVTAAVGVYYYMKQADLTRKVETNKTAVEELRADIANNAEIEVLSRSLYTKYVSLGVFLNNRLSYVVFLDTFLSTIPPSVFVESVTVGTNSTVVVSGRSAGYLAISEFIRNVNRNRQFFSSVALNTVVSDRDTGAAKFTISIGYKPEAFRVRE